MHETILMETMSGNGKYVRRASIYIGNHVITDGFPNGVYSTILFDLFKPWMKIINIIA